MRKIVVDGKEYEYKVGSGNTVVAADGKKRVVSHYDMTGILPHVFEDAQWDKSENGMITPKHIADWIKKNA